MEQQIKGFPIYVEGAGWILYPEPKLKTCCRSGDVKEGVLLGGELPSLKEGHLLTLKGAYSDKNPHLFLVEGGNSELPFSWGWLLILVPLLGLIKKFYSLNRTA